MRCQKLNWTRTCWRTLYERLLILSPCSKDYSFLEYFSSRADDIGREVYIFNLTRDTNYAAATLNISLNIYDFSDPVTCS